MRHRKTFNFQLSTFRFSGGFTLIELLVVISIMAVLTVMSLPALSGYIKGARLRGGAREVASALRMARQLAITKRAIYSVDFDSSNRQFWVKYGSTVNGDINTLPATIRFYNGSPAPTYTYDFTARGTSNSGYIYIVDTNNKGREIVVTGATGNVKVINWSP